MSAADNFRGLPIEELISAPLKAACDSQRELAFSAYQFIMQLGFEENNRPRILSFDLERPAQDPNVISRIRVNAPFLALVPIPALLIDDVQIDFQMEVTDTVSSKETKTMEGSFDAEASYNKLFAKAKVSIGGKVSSARENTRSTNQTAKYQVRVSARQQQPPEGLSRLMDIMATCVEPSQIEEK